MSGRHLFLGCYTPGMAGHGTGIARYDLGDDGMVGALVGSTPSASPSFLVLTGDRLFAVHEESQGAVSSFTRAGAALTPLASVPTDGGEPCHLALDERASLLLVANYGTGSVSTFRVSPGGTLGTAEVTPLPAGSGPVPNRQAAPHAHQIVAAEPGRGTWLVADLGADRLLEFEIAVAGLELVAEHPLPAGTGPRHLAWAEDALLVGGELDSRVHVLRRSGNALVHAGSASSHFGPEDIESYPSHLQVSPDGGVAYLANRVRDTLAVFELGALGSGGLPTLAQEVPCGGHWPRHFAIDSDRLYVANQHSDEVTVFAVTATGRLVDEPVQRISAGSPACIVLG